MVKMTPEREANVTLPRWAWPAAVRVPGLVLLVPGVMVNLAPFAWFVVGGSGTPFPANLPSSRTVMVRDLPVLAAVVVAFARWRPRLPRREGP